MTLKKPNQTLDKNWPCIPVNYSRLIARELELQIRELPDLLQATNLSTEQFTQDDALLSVNQQVQVFQNALALSQDEALGLRLGKRLTPLTHGMMGLLANSSPNILKMLEAIRAFLPTRMNLAHLTIHADARYLECRVTFDMDASENVVQSISESVAIAFFECAKFVLGRPLHEATTHFSHAEPPYVNAYKTSIPGKLQFDQTAVMVKFPIEICEIPNASASEQNYALAYQQCETILKQLYSEKGSFKYQVQKLMLSHPNEALTEDDAAASLFLSKRSLYRKLNAEGTSFRKIKEEILAQRAIDYLRDETMSVEAIAMQLNYHDSANFRRAFKRWFTRTPDQYRRENIG